MTKTGREILSMKVKDILGVRLHYSTNMYSFGFSVENRTIDKEIFEDRSLIISELNGLKQRIDNEITRHIREIEDIRVS